MGHVSQKQKGSDWRQQRTCNASSRREAGSEWGWQQESELLGSRENIRGGVETSLGKQAGPSGKKLGPAVRNHIVLKYQEKEAREFSSGWRGFGGGNAKGSCSDFMMSNTKPRLSFLCPANRLEGWFGSWSKPWSCECRWLLTAGEAATSLHLLRRRGNVCSED